MPKIWMAILAIWVGIAGAAGAQASQYFTDPDLLPAEHKALYETAKSEIDDWFYNDPFPQSAAETLERMAALEPNFLPLYLQQSRLAEIRGWVELDGQAASQEAREILKALIAKQPSYADAHTRLAGNYITSARYQEARDVLDAAGRLEATGELDEVGPWLLCLRSRLLGKMGEFADALDYGEACLNGASEDPDATVEALFRINRYAAQLGRSWPDRDVGTLVFERFEDPLVRVDVAEQLIDAYDGFPGMLSYAFQILTRQQSETPELPAVKLQMARLLFKKAGLRGSVGSNTADRGISSYVLDLLEPIKEDEALRDEVFDLWFAVVHSTDGSKAAGALLETAEARGKVSPHLLMRKRALLYFYSGNYEMAILAFQELGLKYHPLLMQAYEAIGRFDEVEAYYQRLLRDRPNHAWTLGNYAAFRLIQFDDVESAIDYGHRAIAIMNYPLARSNLGLAYLIRASKSFKAGKLEAARADYVIAMAQNPSPLYIERHCGSHCEDIETMVQEIQNQELKNAPLPYEY
ncbi:MAG: tetratricopeptide repeat protein [Pseudomonadota bacterium]